MTMLSALRHHLSVAACFARLAVQRQLENPLFLVGWFLMIPIQYFGWIWMLKMLVQQFQPLAGWTFPQIAFLYGLAQLSHGLMVIFFIQTWGMQDWVINGEFDRLLVRPLNVLFHFSFVYINLIGVIDLIPGSVIFAYGCRATGFAWTPGTVLQVAAVILGAMLIRAAIFLVSGSLSFWTKRSWGMVGLNLALQERCTLYPVAIYPYALQMLLTFVLPIAFISFYPSCDFLGQDARTTLPLGLAVWTPVVGAALMAAAYGVFRLGLKSYESSGS